MFFLPLLGDEAENTYITRRIGRSTGDALSGGGRDRGRSLKSTPGAASTFWLRWTTTGTIYGEEERVDEVRGSEGGRMIFAGGDDGAVGQSGVTLSLSPFSLLALNSQSELSRGVPFLLASPVTRTH